MTNKKVKLGILALALIFGMILVGCGDNGGGGNNDPVTVNLSLPAIQSVAPFTGTFANTEAEQKQLVVDAFEVIAELELGGGDQGYGSMENRQFMSPSKSRAVGTMSPDRSRAVSRGSYSWGPEYETYDHDTEILPGAVVTGFFRASEKGYYKDEDDDTVGDWDEFSLRVKLSIAFDDVEGKSATINGKYVLDETIYEKYQVIALNPYKEKFTENYDINNGYALSISKGGKGIKFVMKETIKVNVNNMVWTKGQDYVNYLDYVTYKFTLDVYDNSNDKKLTKTFNNPEEASEYLGVELSDYF